jgi:hypothetical protein
MELTAVLQDNYHVFEFFDTQFKLPKGKLCWRPVLKPCISEVLRTGSRPERFQAFLSRV